MVVYQNILKQRKYYKYKCCSFEKFINIFEKINPEYDNFLESFYEMDLKTCNDKHYCNEYYSILDNIVYIFKTYKDYKKYYFWVNE